jgi:hypothetical protein
VKLSKDLREFIELLNSHAVEYVVVGGYAVAYHGYPRYTGDIDFFIRPTDSNAELLLEVLDVFGFGEVGLTREDFTTPGRIVQLGLPPNRIDLVTGITGVTFDEVWGNRVPASLDGIPVSLIGKEELLRNKRASGRAKDLADVEAIEPDGDKH